MSKQIFFRTFLILLVLAGLFVQVAPHTAYADDPQPPMDFVGESITTVETITSANPNWTIVEFDLPNADVGRWPSIAISPVTKQPWVVYRNETNHRLEYATRVGTLYGNCGPNNTWSCATLTTDDGEMSSIDFRSDGQLAVSYNVPDLDPTCEGCPAKQKIRYIPGGTQVIAERNNGCQLRDIRFSSLKFASDNTPRVVFYLSEWNDFVPASWNKLIYAHPSGTGLGSCVYPWDTMTVDPGTIGVSGKETTNGFSPSLDINLTNGPVIAYRGVAGSGTPNTLNYAEYQNGWNHWVIDPTPGSGYHITVHAPHCNNCNDGTRIAYYNATYGEVRLARYTGQNADNCGSGGKDRWKCAVIDSVGTGGAMGVSMAHHNGNPVIAYFDHNDQANGILKVARFIAQAGNCGYGAELYKWQCEVVDDGQGQYRVGDYTAAARDSDGRIFIAYWNATNGALRVAYERSPSPVFVKYYAPGVINVLQTSTVYYTLSGSSKEVLTGVSFNDYLLSQTVSPGSLTNTCGGSLTLSNNNRQLNLSGGIIPKGSSCTITAQVTATTAGVWNDYPSSFTSNEAKPSSVPLGKLTVNKYDQTIYFAPLPDRTVGDPPFAVSAVALSGQPVSFSANTSTICAVNGNTVTLTGVAGNCTITASQSGDVYYKPAPSVSRTFAVNNPNKQNQTITFNPLPNKTLGDAPFTINASASSGLSVGFNTNTPNVCSVNSNIVTLITTGTCTIVASQPGNGTYNAAANVSRSFNVNAQGSPANFTIYVPMIIR